MFQLLNTCAHIEGDNGNDDIDNNVNEGVEPGKDDHFYGKKNIKGKTQTRGLDVLLLSYPPTAQQHGVNITPAPFPFTLG